MVIIVKIQKDHGKIIIEAEGHSGYAEAGKDIVCAGVTAVLETALLGVKSIAEHYPEHVVVVEEGE